MRIVKLINVGARDKRERIVVAGAMAGVMNTVILACANAAAKTPDRPSLHLFGIILLSAAAFFACYMYSARQMTTVFERALQRVKIRVTNKIRRMELQGLERIGTAEIYDRITENMTIISDSATALSMLLRCFFMVVFGALFMAYISLPAFVLVTLLFGIGIQMFLGNAKEIRGHLREAARTRMDFFNALTDLLSGFKEVKFSTQRSDELEEDIAQIAGHMRSSTEKANLLLNKNRLIPELNIFALLTALAFVLTQHVPAHAETVSTLLTLTMFIFGPVSGVVVGYPILMRANLALENIDELEKKLEEATHKAAAEADDPWGGEFKSLEARHLEFTYRGKENESAFGVGPLSLTIPSGEVLFIVGGNGSGKSTLLKVLTTLYPPSNGSLRVNGSLVTQANVQALREMISAVYADFYLFKKLYGLRSVDSASVHRLLKLMQLDTTTSYANGRFTSLNLSTGQRKRLALVVAFLEDRPVYAFDEWAAAQDPEFRKYFYEDLIPDLKRRGKTVLVVTHDDRYFHCADRVVTMEYGKVRSIVVNEGAKAGGAGLEAGAGTERGGLR